MTQEKMFEYARDDFNYPRFVERGLRSLLNSVLTRVQAAGWNESQLHKAGLVVVGLGALLTILGSYFSAGVIIGIAIFIDQINLHLFVDRSKPGTRFRHLIEQETPLVLALALHLWIQGHLWSGFAAIIGLGGLYMLTNLQMKYDLMAIQIPRLYFLRWDRMGIMAMFTLLGAWPGERAYLFVVLLAWFLAALTFYDYLWILIQLAKKKNK